MLKSFAVQGGSRVLTFLSLAMFAGVSALSAHATSTTTTVTFAGIGGANQSMFKTYTQNGFTVSSPDNNFYIAKGYQAFGNPKPDIFTITSGILDIVYSGGDFTFTSVDLGHFTAGDISYTITGSLGGQTVYTQTGTQHDGTDSTFLTLAGLDPTTSINALTIALTQNPQDGANVDNLVFGIPAAAATPEPSSLILLGTGVCAAAAVLRRRTLKA